jgi:hypothetical protein
VDETGSRSCLMAIFGMGGVGASGSSTIALGSWF